MLSLQSLAANCLFYNADLYELDDENLVGLVTNSLARSQSFRKRLRDLHSKISMDKTIEIAFDIVHLANRYEVPRAKGKKFPVIFSFFIN